MGAFKAYDIRGVYPDEVNEDLAYKVGRNLPSLLGGGRALIGRDARLSSPSIAEAVARGIADAGCNVDDMGLASTPMAYFATAAKGYDFSVQVTASHNPANCNGLKISAAGARPVGHDTGLGELERLVAEPLPQPTAAKGVVRNVSHLEEFTTFLRRWLPDVADMRLAIDCSDGMASLVVRELFGSGPAYVASEPDGSFPSHAPNPFEPAGRTLITDTVKKTGADVGVVFDGDADRMLLIDEHGDFVRPDLMIAIMARRFLRERPGAAILHDIRTSRGVTEILREEGARPVMWKVGHAFAKVKMREENAAFGGELAGHYYFRDFFWCDSGELAALVALGEIARARREGITLSALAASVNRYANTGELNFRIEDKAAAMERIRNHFVSKREPDAFFDFDGYRIEYPEWWFNVRPSNTEPYLRLIVEAKTAEMLAERRSEIESLLDIRDAAR